MLWLDRAELTYQKNGRPTSHVGAFKTPIRVLRELYGTMPAAQFGPVALEAVRGELVRMGLSRKTANTYVGNVRVIFRWGVSQELIPPQVVTALAALEPLKAGRTKARETAPVAPVADDVVETTLARLPGVVADMVRLQRATGMRPGEVCLMRPVDIERSGELWTYRPQEHKTQHRDRSRVIYLGPKAQAILKSYLQRPATAYCFSPAEAAEQVRQARHAARKTPPHYGNYPGSKPGKRKPARTPGERYLEASYRRAITRACEAAFGKPDNISAQEATAWRAKHCWSPNQLRHTFATVARQVGGIESVQALLGHSRIGTTQIYAERLNALAASVAAKIG